MISFYPGDLVTPKSNLSGTYSVAYLCWRSTYGFSSALHNVLRSPDTALVVGGAIRLKMNTYIPTLSRHGFWWLSISDLVLVYK